MDNELLFYVFGIGTAISAVVVSFIGLKVKGFPGRATPVVILYFAVMVVGAATFSVLHAQDEQHHKEHERELANEIYEGEKQEEPGSHAAGEEEEAGEAEGEHEEGEAAAPPAKGPGGTLQLAADPSALAYDKTELTSKPGKVTIDFNNPAPLEHDVVVEDEGGEELAASEIITEGKSTATGEFAAGSYTFFCSVPGHREAGMEGTLTVK